MWPLITNYCVWQVAAEVSAVSGVKRTTVETKKKWSQMKSQTKEKVVSLKKEQSVTGGGPKTETDLTVQENRVVGVAGEVCFQGISTGIDTVSCMF